MLVCRVRERCSADGPERSSRFTSPLDWSKRMPSSVEPLRARNLACSSCDQCQSLSDKPLHRNLNRFSAIRSESLNLVELLGLVVLPCQIETPVPDRRDMGVAVRGCPIAGLTHGRITRTLVRAVFATPTLGSLTGGTEQLVGRSVRRIVDYRFSSDQERDTMIDLKVVAFVFRSANGAAPALFIEQVVPDNSRYPGTASQLFRSRLFECSKAVSGDPPTGRTFNPEGLKRNSLLPDVPCCARRVIVAVSGLEVVRRDEAMLQNVIDDSARTLARHLGEEFGKVRVNFFHTHLTPRRGRRGAAGRGSRAAAGGGPAPRGGGSTAG